MKKILSLFIIISIAFSLISCWKKDINNDNEIINNKIIEITNYTELNTSIFNLYDLIIEWWEIDNKTIKLVKNKNLDFFNYYKLSQKKWKEVLNQTIIINNFLNNKSKETSFFFEKVYAKKRWSVFYYIPIFWSLLKAKHKTIETTRAGIYHYIKDSLDQEDRNALLSSYSISNIEDIRNIDDSKIEELARDPELNGAIDWTKVTKDLWETAVTTVVEASQAITWWSFNPISWTADNIKDDLKDFKLDTVWNKIKKEKSKLILENKTKEDKILFWIKKETKEKIDKVYKDKNWKELDEKEKKEISSKILETKWEKLITINKSNKAEIKVDLEAWEWDFNISDKEVWVLWFEWIDINQDSYTKIDLVKKNVILKDDKTPIQTKTNNKNQNNNNEEKDSVYILNWEIYNPDEQWEITENEKKNGINWEKRPILIKYEDATEEEKEKYFPNRWKKEENKYLYDWLWLWIAVSNKELDSCSDATIRLTIKENNITWKAFGWWDTLIISWKVTFDWEINWWFAKAKENVANFKWKINKNTFKWQWSDAYWCYWSFSLDKDI